MTLDCFSYLIVPQPNELDILLPGVVGGRRGLRQVLAHEGACRDHGAGGPLLIAIVLEDAQVSKTG